MAEVEMWHRVGQHRSDLQSVSEQGKSEREKKRVWRCSFAALPPGGKVQRCSKKKKFRRLQNSSEESERENMLRSGDWLPRHLEDLRAPLRLGAQRQHSSEVTTRMWPTRHRALDDPRLKVNYFRLIKTL